MGLEDFDAIPTFVTRVVRVADENPRLRRITFGGGDLARFAPLGPDTFVYVLLPPPGRRDLTVDRSFTWLGWAATPEEDRAVGGYYTVRAWRPEPAEVDALFVLHEPAGPASAWAARAEPGDPVALWGPREAYAPPPGTEWLLLVADETGQPAVANVLEARPEGLPALVVVEADGPAARLDLALRPGDEVRWLDRAGAAPGADPSRVERAVRSLVLPGGSGYAWGGGESRIMTAVRRYLRVERGMARAQVTMVAYWRHARSPADPGDDAPL